MADNATVHIGENSPEKVAYDLTKHIASLEGKSMYDPVKGADRKWLLDTYAECLVAVKGFRDWGP